MATSPKEPGAIHGVKTGLDQLRRIADVVSVRGCDEQLGLVGLERAGD
jgi:hypothetical protein